MKFLTAHLKEVDETYFEHFRAAMIFVWHLLSGAALCAVHAIFPFVFQTSGSERVAYLYDRMVVNRTNK